MTKPADGPTGSNPTRGPASERTPEQTRGGAASHPFDDAAQDDAALIRAIGAGSEDAFRELFHRWAHPLRRFLIRATGSREAGEDLLQEAFLRVLRAAPGYVPEAPPAAWLFRICANLSYSFWRKESRAPTPLSQLDASSPDDVRTGRARGLPGSRSAAGNAPRWTGWSGPGAEPGPEEMRRRRLFAHDLDAALAELPANQRMAFLLKAVQGLTYEAAAQVLGCPEGTVKSRFHHAVLRLRSALREWDGGFVTDAPPSARREARQDGV